MGGFERGGATEFYLPDRLASMDVDIQRDRARSMRKGMTGAERRLWSAIRGRALNGFRFNRQVEVGPFIVDFLCREKKTIVEVDGVTHGEEFAARDLERTRYLEGRGYVVFRAWNDEVYGNLDGVLESLLSVLEER